jgi:hypothetical protein
MKSIRPLVVSILTTLLQLPQKSEPFSSWFISPQSCWVDLRDTKEEVIMNNFIVPVNESSHADDVQIEVFEVYDSADSKGSEETLRPVDIIVEQSGKRVVYIDNLQHGKECKQRSSISMEDDDEKITIEYVLKLNVKEEAKLYDLQYVMDAKSLPESEEEDDNTDVEIDNDEESHLQPQIIAQFNRRNGCDNMRGYGKEGDNGLTLKIQVPSSIYDNPDLIDSNIVDVVAGWACGHEAVTLTYNIEFRPRINNSCTSSYY